uniref:Tyrosine-protein phosphatase domain-containing protein n=1 Tax=Strongyloides papillosus TaxID=174720 RepID=A0A0N5CG60_STREA
MDNNKDGEKKKDSGSLGGDNQTPSKQLNILNDNDNTTKTVTAKVTVRRRHTRRQKVNPGASRITHTGTNRKRNVMSMPTPYHEKSLVLRLLQIVKLQNPSLDEKPGIIPPPFSLGGLLDDCIKKGIEGLTIEFLSLSRSRPNPADYVTFLLPENRQRNRYRDILCLENGRVKLKDAPNDYIHANYVKTPRSDKAFICTQGPTDKSCGDFWKMCLQEEVEYIIMLCQFEENGIKKCAKYYPFEVGGSLTFGSTVVTNEKLNECTDNDMRDINLKIQCDSINKTIRHLQYLGWPDKGVPDITDTLFNILDIVKNSTKPVVVHCSAGIGRTGTFVLVQNMMERVYNPQNGGNDTTIQIIKDMRNYRHGVVQTDFQYIFAHRLVLGNYIKTKKIDVEGHRDLNRWIISYKKIYEKYITTCKPSKTGTVEEET